MVKRGFYKHYKGPTYFVEGVGKMHDKSFRIVVYQSTQSAVDGEPRLRLEDEFEQHVDPTTGFPCSSIKHGLCDSRYCTPRFARVEKREHDPNRDYILKGPDGKSFHCEGPSGKSFRYSGLDGEMLLGRSGCGCNVFRKPNLERPNYYVCNACGTGWVNEKNS